MDSEHTVSEQLELCRSHQDRLVKIETVLESILQRLNQQNGSIAEALRRVGKIEVKCAAHDSMSVSDTRAHDGIEEEMESLGSRVGAHGKELEELRTDLAHKRGMWSGVLGTVKEVLVIAGILIALWQGWLSHKELDTAARHAPAAQGR